MNSRSLRTMNVGRKKCRRNKTAAVILAAALAVFAPYQTETGWACTGQPAEIQTPMKTQQSSWIRIQPKTHKSPEQRPAPDTQADTPLKAHGALRVEGAYLKDAKGENYQLRGMSTHGIAWFPQYVNQDAFQTLRDDWGANCVRLAMYTDEYGGYCSGGNREELKRLVDSGVSKATELGMYVIVDWHVLNNRDPGVHKAEAIAFFDEMAARWKDHDNVIYEICNEPNSGATWEGIKAYAEEVIPAIRRHDPDAVIIVGTPTWSQDIDQAAKSPLEFDNVMYALHFYAGTHGQWLRDRCEACVKQGLPVFVSEFGMCDASGNGANDFGQAEQWMSLMEKYNLSWCCWNLANKNEKSSVLKPECSKVSGWSDGDLSESGLWIREKLRKPSEKR